jgi:hypothetical protein
VALVPDLAALAALTATDSAVYEWAEELLLVSQSEFEAPK